MAKEIYIDENGNEHLVSGTINTANMLPISAQDNTATKDYIDDGLSGKADKAYTSSTFTNDSASVSIGSKNIVYKQGNVAYITLVLIVSGNISGGMHLVHSSIDLGSGGYIMAINDTNGAHMLATNGNYIDALLPIQSGTNLRISFSLFVP